MSGMVVQGLGVKPATLGPTSVTVIVAGKLQNTVLKAIIKVGQLTN